jgi:hypothetical protein
MLPQQKMPCKAGEKWPARASDPYPTPTPRPEGSGAFWHTVWGCWIVIRMGGIPFRVSGVSLAAQDEERVGSALTAATMVLYEE